MDLYLTCPEIATTGGDEIYYGNKEGSCAVHDMDMYGEAYNFERGDGSLGAFETISVLKAHYGETYKGKVYVPYGDAPSFKIIISAPQIAKDGTWGGGLDVL
jgi:hypothetical protein